MYIVQFTMFNGTTQYLNDFDHRLLFITDDMDAAYWFELREQAANLLSLHTKWLRENTQEHEIVEIKDDGE